MTTPPKLGIIVSLRPDRSFGFITPTDPAREGEEIFFHATAAKDFPSLSPGDTVQFIEVHTKKGLRAVGVAKEEA